MSKRLYRQQGVSLMAALLVIVALCIVGLLIMKTFPTYLEAKAIDSAILKARNAAGGNEAEVRRQYDRLMSVDDIKSVSGADLTVKKEGETLLVSYAYTAKIGLFGPVSLQIDYSGSTKGR